MHNLSSNGSFCFQNGVENGHSGDDASNKLKKSEEAIAGWEKKYSAVVAEKETL